MLVCLKYQVFHGWYALSILTHSTSSLIFFLMLARAERNIKEKKKRNLYAIFGSYASSRLHSPTPGTTDKLSPISWKHQHIFRAMLCWQEYAPIHKLPYTPKADLQSHTDTLEYKVNTHQPHNTPGSFASCCCSDYTDLSVTQTLQSGSCEQDGQRQHS